LKSSILLSIKYLKFFGGMYFSSNILLMKYDWNCFIGKTPSYEFRKPTPLSLVIKFFSNFSAYWVVTSWTSLQLFSKRLSGSPARFNMYSLLLEKILAVSNCCGFYLHVTCVLSLIQGSKCFPLYHVIDQKSKPLQHFI